MDKMVKCSAPMCYNATYNKSPDITFHRFPKDVKLRNAWLANMNVQNWQPLSHSVLCSKHFQSVDIDDPGFRTRLLPGTIPTIFDSPLQEKRIVSESSDENSMILNMYKHIKDTWPANEYPLKTSICEKTACILGISLTKLCMILKKNSIDMSDSPKRNTPTQKEKKCFKDDKNTSFVDKGKDIVQNIKPLTKANITIFKCGLCNQEYKNKMLLDRHLKIHTDKKIKNNDSGDYSEIASRLKPLEDWDSLRSDNDESQCSLCFECPICNVIFPQLDKAMDHLHEYHSKEFASNLQSIKTVSATQCPTCKKSVKSVLMHICLREATIIDGNELIQCMVCDRHFRGIGQFDSHALLVHGTMRENMYFPTVGEFITWKQVMEKESLVPTYTMVKLYDGKKYYYCQYISKPRNQLCPSVIIAQEFPQGVKVTFINKHSGHSYLEFKLPPKFQKYYITKLLQPIEEYNAIKGKPDDNDQYLQYKMLLENVIMEAAKINIAGLKLLMGKALEMTTILTSSDEDRNDMDKMFTTLSDAQISDVLINKRPASDIQEESDAKKFKSDTMSPKIINAFSLAEGVKIKSETESDDEVVQANKIVNRSTDNGSQSLLEKQLTKKEESGTIENQRVMDNNKVTFNDTYKDFVTKNCISSKEYSHLKTFASRNKRPVVKTKMGQFNPGKQKSPDDQLKSNKNANKGSYSLKTEKSATKGSNNTSNPLRPTYKGPNNSINGSKIKGPNDSFNASKAKGPYSSLKAAKSAFRSSNNTSNFCKSGLMSPSDSLNSVTADLSPKNAFNSIRPTAKDPNDAFNKVASKGPNDSINSVKTPLSANNSIIKAVVSNDPNDYITAKRILPNNTITPNLVRTAKGPKHLFRSAKSSFKRRCVTPNLVKIPSKSPIKEEKEDKARDETPISSPGSKKVDYEYEVIEQEADCNILVLKM